jgi:hypothetical protein
MIYRIVYFSLITIAFILSVNKQKKNKGYIYLSFILLLAIVTDIIHVILQETVKQYQYIPYHIYIPAEYIFLSLFLYSYTQNKILQNILIVSMPIPLIVELLFISKNYFVQFPSLIYNISGALIMLWSIIILLQIPVQLKINVTTTPIFWFCTAFIIFFSGQFFMNGFYNRIQEVHPAILKPLSNVIYYSLNYILYILIIIALICSPPKTKYI